MRASEKNDTLGIFEGKSAEPGLGGMNVDQVVEWYTRLRQRRLDHGAVQELYALLHPRAAFLKTLASEARVLDLGAGDGSLATMLGWPKPVRRDLELHAYSLEKGVHFDDFASWELGDWNKAPPVFDGLEFDAVLCSHFIEHVAVPTSVPSWLGSRLSADARVYIEWPSENALLQPRRATLLERGVDLTISHFHDDATHRDLPARAQVIAALEREGFVIEAQGVIRLPWLEEQLMACFRDSEDPFGRQAAFWLATGWSQYVVAVRSSTAGARKGWRPLSWGKKTVTRMRSD